MYACVWVMSWPVPPVKVGLVNSCGASTTSTLMVVAAAEPSAAWPRSVTVLVARSPAPGVPEKVRVAASNCIQPGIPVAEKVSGFPICTAAKTLAATCSW